MVSDEDRARGSAFGSAEAAAHARVVTRLKAAVASHEMPAGLPARIRAQLRRPASKPVFAVAWTPWAAAAAVLLLCAGFWAARRHTALPDLADRHGQDLFIQKVSETIFPVLRVGLGDHIHCSVFRRYPKNPPTLQQMAGSMGPAYKDLVPLITQNVPDDYRILMAHQCGYSGRRFVHITLSDGSNRMSLVITRKQPGETLQPAAPALRAHGVPVYQATASRYEVAGFETEQYLAFVVSDLSFRHNLQVASKLAPAVHTFLKSQG